MLRVIGSIILAVVMSFGIGPGVEASSRVDVVTTLFPLYDFTREVGGDHLNLTLLVPPGVETHSFEPTPRDIIRINKADLFIYTGKEMEPWIEEILLTIENKDLMIVDTSKGIHFRKIKDHDDADHHSHHHEEVEKDPHFWLNLGNSQLMVKTIAKALTQVDPLNREIYLKKASLYKSDLKELDQRFSKELSNCRFRRIISGGHLTFGYLTDRYRLEYISAYKNFAPNAEPSPKSIARLIKSLRESKMNVVFYEELINPKVARIISQETGVRMELLHGAHNISRKEMKMGTRFTDLMEANLKKLKAGLECQ